MMHGSTRKRADDIGLAAELPTDNFDAAQLMDDDHEGSDNYRDDDNMSEGIPHSGSSSGSSAVSGDGDDGPADDTDLVPLAEAVTAMRTIDAAFHAVGLVEKDGWLFRLDEIDHGGEHIGRMRYLHGFNFSIKAECDCRAHRPAEGTCDATCYVLLNAILGFWDKFDDALE